MKRTMSVLVAALALGACGGVDEKDAGHSTAGHPRGAGSVAATAGHNAQDARFVQMMIPHHQQAVAMAEQAAQRASSSKVRRLAARIARDQDPQIHAMTGWLKEWGTPMPSPGGMHMGDGMMSDADMKRLGALSGERFDEAFLRMMIEHHHGAVTMARTEQARGSDAEARAMAGSIVTAQSAEIRAMRKLLTAM
ncbi:DUF305 domain-containing protein [Actinoallomurus bryophytorum]|nr:DUF305 domain-containing protein [Actinoallomurus bryophytorum]